MHYARQVTFIALLPEMHDLSLIERKHQANPDKGPLKKELTSTFQKWIGYWKIEKTTEQPQIGVDKGDQQLNVT